MYLVLLPRALVTSISAKYHWFLLAESLDRPWLDLGSKFQFKVPPGNISALPDIQVGIERGSNSCSLMKNFDIGVSAQHLE